MFSFQHAQNSAPKPHQESAFQRVSVNLSGRLMLASHEEYDCTALEMSPGDVLLTSLRVRAAESVSLLMSTMWVASKARCHALRTMRS